jgi:hypothetical protein
MTEATEAARVEKIKKTLNESKNAPNSRVEVRLKSKQRVTGAVNEVKDNWFVLNNVRSGAHVTIAYEDVTDVKRRTTSRLTKAGIAAFVGGVAVLTVAAVVARATSR